MARKKAKSAATSQSRLVNYDFQNRTYEIDPERQKVYRRFVEIETSKAVEIYSHWRARAVSA